MSAMKVSFEFFPPKNDEAETSLWNALRRLETVHPQFVSVTYGAGGTTRDRTLGTVARIVKETSLAPAAHLTCVGASKEEVNEVLRDFCRAQLGPDKVPASIRFVNAIAKTAVTGKIRRPAAVAA